MTTPWISVGELKMRRGLKDPLGRHDSDPLFENVIKVACAAVERFTGRGRLLLTRYDKRFCGDGHDELFLPHVPVRTVSQVVIGDAPIVVTTADAFYTGGVSGSAFYTERSVTRLGLWPRGKANIRVVWEAGYATPGDVPEDVRSATIALAVLLSKEAERYGDQQKDLGGVSVQYVRNLEGTDRIALYTFRDWGRAMVEPGVEVNPPVELNP